MLFGMGCYDYDYNYAYDNHHKATICRIQDRHWPPPLSHLASSPFANKLHKNGRVIWTLSFKQESWSLTRILTISFKLAMTKIMTKLMLLVRKQQHCRCLIVRPCPCSAISLRTTINQHLHFDVVTLTYSCYLRHRRLYTDYCVFYNNNNNNRATTTTTATTTTMMQSPFNGWVNSTRRGLKHSLMGIRISVATMTFWKSCCGPSHLSDDSNLVKRWPLSILWDWRNRLFGHELMSHENGRTLSWTCPPITWIWEEIY